MWLRCRQFLAQCGSVEWFGLAAMVVGLVLRLLAARGDPWLDEITAWQLACEGKVVVPLDSNHVAYTLWLWIVHDSFNVLLWRSLSILCGVLSIAAVGMIMRRSGKPHAIIGMMLACVSYPLLVYQSEARGYSMVLLSMLAAIELALRQCEGRVTPHWRGWFLTVCVLGVLSHPTFMLFYVLLVIWMLLQRPGGLVLGEQKGVLLFMAVWCVLFVWRIPPLPVRPWHWQSVLTDAATNLGVAVPVAVMMVLVVAGVALYGHQKKLAVFLLIVLAIYPIAVAAKTSGLLYTRYFLPATMALVLMLSGLLGELWRRGRTRPVAVVLLTMLLTIQFTSSIPLLTQGHGSQQSVLAKLEQLGGTIATQAGYDNQLRSLTSYFDTSSGHHLGSRIVAPGQGADWLIVMRADSAASLSQGEWSYHAVDRAETTTWSGTGWTVYRRSDPVAQRPPG